MTTIKLKRSDAPGKVPLPGDLELGELALNTADGNLFLKKNDGTVEPVGDAMLRQDLANPDKGALMVRGSVIYVDTIADLQALDTSGLVEGQAALVKDESRFVFHQGEWVRSKNPYWVSAEEFDSLDEAIDSGLSVYVPDGEWHASVGRDVRNLFGPGVVVIGGNRFVADRKYAEWSVASCEKAQELSVGLPDDALFPEAYRAMQGLAYNVTPSGQERLYMMQRSGGSSYTENETNRIIEYNFTRGGTVESPVSLSEDLKIGHQGLSALREDGSLYLYSGFPVEPGKSGSTNTGKGFSKIQWKGSDTSDVDVTFYQLFGYVGSGHVFEKYHNGTPTVSTCGRYLVIIASRQDASVASWCFIYDRGEVESASNTLDVMPIHKFLLPPITESRAYFSQAVACDGKYVYTYTGFVNPFFAHKVRKFDFFGNKLSEVQVDGIRGYYGRKVLEEGSPTLGCPRSMEPEGMTLAGNELLLITTDNWREYGDIVTSRGVNFAYMGAGDNPEPDSNTGSTEWIFTTRPSNAGAWSSGGSYSRGPSTRYGKVVTSFKPTVGASEEYPVDSGIIRETSTAAIVTGNTSRNISYPYGERFQVGAYATNSEQWLDSLQFAAGNRLQLHDANAGADNTTFCSIYNVSRDGSNQMQIRAGQNNSEGAGITLHRNEDSGGVIRMYTGGSLSFQINSTDTRALRAGSDDAQNLGTGGTRWRALYVATGTINTSDVREKQQVSTLSAAESAAASELKGMIRKFKWNHAVEVKGESARWHFGVMAQEVAEVFDRHGLDAHEYGLFCYDEWAEQPEKIDEQSGKVVEEYRPAGDRYGVRYDQLLAFIISAM